MATKDTTSTKEQYYAALASNNVSPLWTVLSKMVPPRVNPTAQVTSWPYESICPLLMDSGTLITAEEAGRQLILPGETAPAHRHVAFALRFIVEGSRGFTAGVILTPSWHWHDHGSEGMGPMVWLDGLDLPVYRFLPKFPWAQTAAALDANPAELYARYEYRLENGAYLSQTIGAREERVAAGTTTRSILRWKARDTFSEGNAYLFAVNDMPMIEALGLYRQEVV
ncbi:RmlC-like cupin domain-containing protein [Thermothelomyces heterothallicus CBS 202.75]|uniref:RmlC-like cupin domain-containing protein n=1 Tax=Thermothelomyces heterothallicus CBS 202.75 TaxID=1149848 RepID=UPI003743F80A